MQNRRDCLFISYASEDWPLAEWLALKLTAEGYRVWCDRFRLLGGMSFPRDVDGAIKEKTFRLLALLSTHSIQKPNPLKERTLAHAIGRERGEDFLIPIKVDKFKPTELGWMESDLNYISFDRDWAGGFGALLDTLQKTETPQPLADGRRATCDWLAARDCSTARTERVWSNLLPIIELPETLLLVEPAASRKLTVNSGWPHIARNDGSCLSFERYPSDDHRTHVTEVPWLDQRLGRQSLNHAATQLLNQHLRAHCMRLGMQETPEGHLYFPADLLPNDRIQFRRFDGKKTWVLASGIRTFRTVAGNERNRYYLSPTFRASIGKYGFPCVDVHLRVHLTTLDHQTLPPHKANRRRKRVCKNWWNYQWLARTSAVAQWMASGEETFVITNDPERMISVAGTPLSFASPAGILEEGAGQREEMDDLEEVIHIEDDHEG